MRRHSFLSVPRQTADAMREFRTVDQTMHRSAQTMNAVIHTFARWMFAALTSVVALSACRAVSRLPDQTYYGASSNWAFRKHYPPADRLFNAFDYGHAILYERLLLDAGHATDAAPALESREFDYITKQLLVHPPALPLEERAIAPRY